MGNREKIKKVLRKDFREIPWSYPIKKTFKPFLKLRKVRKIGHVFTDYFAFSSVQTDEEKQLVSNLRYKVYCEELGFNFSANNGKEMDNFDAHSAMCLITHKSSGLVAGTIRLVESKSDDEYLPIEVSCPTLDNNSKLHPAKLKREEIGELSRLAVSPFFRRRNIKNSVGMKGREKATKLDTVAHSIHLNDDVERRCFSFIAIALYFAAAVMAKKANKKYIFVIVKPGLARNMRFVGINFKRIGAEFEYQGLRAPYCITAERFFDGVPASFKVLLNSIESALDNPDSKPMKSTLT